MCKTCKGKYYMTTAIAYTSGKPHIGNTYEIVLADSIARYKRHKTGQAVDLGELQKILQFFFQYLFVFGLQCNLGCFHITDAGYPIHCVSNTWGGMHPLCAPFLNYDALTYPPAYVLMCNFLVDTDFPLG